MLCLLNKLHRVCLCSSSAVEEEPISEIDGKLLRLKKLANVSDCERSIKITHLIYAVLINGRHSVIIMMRHLKSREK